MSDKPTHADEIDCLRLQNAILKRDAAIRVAQDAADAANAAIKLVTDLGTDVKAKYGLASDDDQIDFETGLITRVG